MSGRPVQLDPLAVLAILHNPRAVTSSVRLFNPPNPDVHRWSPYIMVGSALVPFKVLVDQLGAKRGSTHPAIALCQSDEVRLRVTTDLPGRFTELPISRSNYWLDDILRHKSTTSPQNDIVVVHVEDVFGAKTKDAQKVHTIGFILLVRLVGLSQVLFIFLVAGLSLVFLIDLWGIALFATIIVHLLFCEALSLSSLVSRLPGDVPKDNTRRHAIHTRQEGGKVMFVGRQDTLERWARTHLSYNRSNIGTVVYWCWTLSGAMTCTASVVCFPNMTVLFQIAFIALVAISSFMEILTTAIAHQFHQKRIHHGRVSRTIGNNATWSSAIIRATYMLPPEFVLDQVDWIVLEQLPDESIFHNLVTVLRKNQEDFGYLARNRDELVQVLMSGETGDEKHRALAQRLASEVEVVFREMNLLQPARVCAPRPPLDYALPPHESPTYELVQMIGPGGVHGRNAASAGQQAVYERLRLGPT